MDTKEKNGRQYSVRVRVNHDELEFLRRVADAEDRTVSGVLRLALREFHEKRIEQEAS